MINNLVTDLCENSSYEKGLCFSDKTFNLIKEIKRFNYENIYLSERIEPSREYFKVVLNRIYDTLKETFFDKEKIYEMYPKVANDFETWLSSYWNINREEKYKNSVIFDISNLKDFCQAIIYYISGMTDNYAIEMYNSIIGF